VESRTKRFDPITLELMWSRLISIAQEQARALVQASFTSAVAEMEDMASGIYDSHGNIIAQGVTGTQGVLIGLTRGIKPMLAKYPPVRLEPGDVLISNDPWLFSGHKYDISIAAPVFLEGHFVGMTGTISHGADIGGIKSSADSEEVYDEGLHIPILKFLKAGKVNEDVFEMIRSNVRMPDLVMGDLMAQVSACEVGARKLVAFMREYGMNGLDDLSAVIMDHTEAALREAVRNMPDGSWTHTSKMDGIDEPLFVKATMMVQGDEMSIDFTGTSPQTKRGGINCTATYRDAYVFHAIKTTLIPEVPNNEGLFRSVRITAPEGSLLNAKFPAPVKSRFMMITCISSAVFGCLVQALPGRVIAECGTSQMQLLSGLTKTGAPFVYWLNGVGGMGARPGLDGYHATCFPANVGNVPVEIIENVSPVRVVSKKLITDSGGAGKWRGGCDQEIVITVDSPHSATIHCFFEHTTVDAAGYSGGKDGRRAMVKVNGKDIPPKGKWELEPGDELAYSSCGGGGLFPPEERDPEAVLEDVLEGYVSGETARRDYRVAVDLGRRCIDMEETTRIRDRKE
jgi:N-methylhydantoinase B